MNEPRHPAVQASHGFGTKPQTPAPTPQVAKPVLRPAATVPPAVQPPATPQPQKPAHDEDLSPITLEDSPSATDPFAKIKAFGVGDEHKATSSFKRKTVATGTGAIRVRSFHGRLSDQGLGYLDDAINEWLDNNPTIEIKHVTTAIGTFEGKLREPALIMNIWY